MNHFTLDIINNKIFKNNYKTNLTHRNVSAITPTFYVSKVNKPSAIKHGH